MAKGEIIIDDKNCRGCALCVEFCKQGCIDIPGTKFTAEGYLLAEFSHPDKCNGCGVCGWMCPQFAIEAFKYVQSGEPKSERPKAKKTS